ncbi:MAG: hypothetical protein IPM79_25535 [Polyangiaceae bacterium]|jgi:hypothetical protein|nr:hypothetical protein [Polyangiaceae bacterium]MBK8940888.1 hypothetical protein [Polyangiaceae bacterium]
MSFPRISAAALCLLVPLAGCAGSIKWDDPGEVDVLPGSTVQTTVTLVVEGSYEDTYTFSVTPDTDGVTATINPSSGEVLDGEPFEATVTIEVADTVTTEQAGVYLEALPEGGSALAGTTLIVNIEQPAP